ncbi:unnamed protein product, partial [Symbiodinium microadriaticum]
DSSLQRTLGAESEVISSTLSQASKAYAPPPPIARPDTPPNDPQPVMEAAQNLHIKPASYGDDEVVPQQRDKIAAAKPEPEQFNSLTSSLFASRADTQAEQAASSGLFGPTGADDEDELRMPTRTVHVQKTRKESTPMPVTGTANSISQDDAANRAAATASTTTSPQESKKGSIFDRMKGGIK